MKERFVRVIDGGCAECAGEVVGGVGGGAGGSSTRCKSREAAAVEVVICGTGKG